MSARLIPPRIALEAMSPSVTEDGSPDPLPLAQPLEPGVRAARKRLGWSQARAAEECGVVLASFVRWDRGATKPRDPATAQQLSEGLRTPIEVLWPPEDNPVAATALQAMRSRRAIEDGAETKPQPTTLGSPVGAPRPERPDAIVPDVLDVLHTIDRPRKAGPSRLPGRRLLAVGAAVAILAAAVLVVVSSGDEDPAPSTAAVTTRSASTSTVDSARLARVAEMKAAAARGDYNAAIATAVELGDPAEAGYRAEAGAVLVRRAGTAAKRGDLPLARQRLRAAERRYDTAPGGTAVEAQIERIQRARAERARAERAAKRRAAARRRAAAAAANTPPRTSAPAQTSAQAATPTPAPTQGTPQSSSGAASKSSSEKKSDCGNGCGLGPFP